MHVEEFRTRKREGKPIESARELVHALNEVRERVPERSPQWYLMNQFARTAMELADREECPK